MTMNFSKTLMDSLSNIDSQDVMNVLSNIDVKKVQETLSQVDIKELLESLTQAGGKELLETLAQCKSVEDIIALARQFGKNLMREEAETLFAQFKENRDEEKNVLCDVAGGLGGILHLMSDRKDG